MQLFRNPDRHSIIDVIEYNGPADALVWKHECENFNTGSQLIVSEGQVAVFYKNGQALQTFEQGKHTLTTDNYPFIRALIRRVAGGRTPFQCAVYFVNKTIVQSLSWGTDSPIHLTAPIHDLGVDITAGGDFSIQIDDEKKLLLKIVGPSDSFKEEDLKQSFKERMAVEIRSQISTVIKEENFDVRNLNGMLKKFSSKLLPGIQEIFDEYGILIKHFTVSSIHCTGLEEIEEALKNRTVRRINGVDYLGDRSLDIAETLANNPGPAGGGSIGVNSMMTGSMKPSGGSAVDIIQMVMERANGTQGSGNPPAQEPTLDGIMPDGFAGGMMTAESSGGKMSVEEFKRESECLAILRDDKHIDEMEYKTRKQALMKKAGLL